MTMVRYAIVRRWTPEEDALLVQLFEEGKMARHCCAAKTNDGRSERRAGFLRARSAFRTQQAKSGG